jgi:hypothetical protein
MTYGKTYRVLEADELLARQRESLIRSVELNRYTGDKADPNKKLKPFHPSCLNINMNKINVIYLRPFAKSNFNDIRNQVDLLDPKKDTVYCISVWEQVNSGLLKQHIDFLLKFIKNKFKVKILLHECHRFENLSDFNKYAEIDFLDTFCYQTHFEIFNRNQDYNKIWNPIDQYLFFIGKPMKINRIGLLYLLYKNNLLDNIKYSLYVPDHLKNITYKHIPEKISFPQFEEFLNKVNNSNLDDVVYVPQEESMHFDSFPYDYKLFSNTGMSIVSETYFYSKNSSGLERIDPSFQFITEKTYKPIFNHHPFIIAGSENMLLALKKKGYKTFDNFFLKTYDNISTDYDRLNYIVECIKEFKKIIITKKDEINHDIEYNFNVAYKRGLICRKQLVKFFNTELDEKEIYHFLIERI